MSISELCTHMHGTHQIHRRSSASMCRPLCASPISDGALDRRKRALVLYLVLSCIIQSLFNARGDLSLFTLAGVSLGQVKPNALLDRCCAYVTAACACKVVSQLIAYLVEHGLLLASRRGGEDLHANRIAATVWPALLPLWLVVLLLGGMLVTRRLQLAILVVLLHGAGSFAQLHLTKAVSDQLSICALVGGKSVVSGLARSCISAAFYDAIHLQVRELAGKKHGGLVRR